MGQPSAVSPGRRRSKRLRVDFSSSKANRSLNPLVFAVMGGPGTVVVQGGLSVGRTGWSLSAQVHRFRRTLHLWVTARQRDAADGRDVEDHNYIATLADIRPGSYRVRISHIYIPWGQEAGLGGSIQVFEHSVLVE